MFTSSLCPAADTPIEEFTPTPAFPALQYLESVDEGGVAWQAGLRTGDFLIEVRAANTLNGCFMVCAEILGWAEIDVVQFSSHGKIAAAAWSFC